MNNGWPLILEEIVFIANLLKRTKTSQGTRGPFGGITAVLQLLQQTGPQTVPQLARTRGTSRQNIQLIVNRLAKAGHLTLGSNPAHKRSALFELTESGQSLLARTTEREKAFL